MNKVSKTLANELDLHKNLRRHTTRKLILPGKREYTSSLCPKYTLPTASLYATINGDEKLACMRITLRAMKRDLGNRKDFTPYQQCYVELVIAGSPASGNGGEEPFLIGIRKYRDIVKAEKERLKAIERARKDLGKKYLWPRWGKPRTRKAGREGCLKEVRHIVYKRRGREGVVSTCLDRRGFREVNICDNCELIHQKNHSEQIDFIQSGHEYGRRRKALWDKLNNQGEVQGAAPNKEDLDDGLEDSIEEDFMDVDEVRTDDTEESHGSKENVDIDEDTEMEDTEMEDLMNDDEVIWW
ncbi:MAG: hypothetical protein LQ347_002204 [Umbilicaria vellea]|nr:MAG: hypothetical protein LQ347_002204 [Umbilicaria vellea]